MITRNPNPIFTRFICNNNFLENNPICLADVGARFGPQQQWQSLKNCLKFIGFDVDRRECDRLNEFYRKTNLDFTLYPYAISDSKGKKKFCITRLPNSWSFIGGNQEVIKRFYFLFSKSLEIVKEVEIDTMSIDDFVKEYDVPYIDFLKIDVEGAEFSVLKGSERSFSSYNILGVETELNVGPFRDPDNLSNIDSFLRKHDFHLFDMELSKYPRKTFPQGFLSYEGQNFKAGSSIYGQILTGDAVYLRDPIFEKSSGIKKFEWNDTNVLKMAIIYDLYMLFDCAIELLQEYQSNHTSNLPFEHFYNLLTPLINNFGRLTYNEYVNLSSTAPYPEMEVYKNSWIKD